MFYGWLYVSLDIFLVIGVLLYFVGRYMFHCLVFCYIATHENNKKINIKIYEQF
jgi:hypothetical protein